MTIQSVQHPIDFEILSRLYYLEKPQLLDKFVKTTTVLEMKQASDSSEKSRYLRALLALPPPNIDSKNSTSLEEELRLDARVKLLCGLDYHSLAIKILLQLSKWDMAISLVNGLVKELSTLTDEDRKSKLQMEHLKCFHILLTDCLQRKNYSQLTGTIFEFSMKFHRNFKQFLLINLIYYFILSISKNFHCK